MKKFFPAFLCLLGAVAGLAAQDSRAGEAIPLPVAAAFSEAGIPVLREAVPLADFVLPLTDGTNLDTEKLRGKVVFLNFWATWCGPCRAEMPSMETLYGRFKDRGLEILAVNLQESPRQVAAFMEQWGFTFPAALDSRGTVGNVYGVMAIPTTYIVNREGGIIARVRGSLNWDNPKLFSAFETLLNSP
ncbi:MAG: TlpA family protein disulfide reductase [Treponema sp.]|jgi:thiol-disulfide isomerase/thioredoxin|nr:TlpA family protein disulfide reductase [Treponema sp.]